ncbi:complex I assembly factor ACAD9, mitochondrial-like [Mya arenaria]|uniref:complex I assembly factor ACAD9, mitochondrial-like n=1 Tax=Mya arenaria TaxID=6604 RepID=UPI0022E05D39|nr:complex I assembly factor ACAD9, mitochondrial-like [Mya arenaria]
MLKHSIKISKLNNLKTFIKLGILPETKHTYRNALWCRMCSKSVRESSESSSTVQDARGHDVERSQKNSTKRLKNVPFVKELFVGRFDKEMLHYPELDSSEDVDHLNELIAPVEKFFTEAVDSQKIDREGKIPEELIRQLGDLGLFGQQIPHEYGGLELDSTGYARMAEVTALDAAVAVTFAGHQAIGLKGLLIAGTPEQKQQYLPKLATGEHIAAFCLTEPTSGSDAASIQTRATLSEDGRTFYLNGGKIWITNGGIADVFTVFAKTVVTDENGKTEDKVTAFFVERAFGGVTSGQPEDKLGIRGSNTCEVHFDNTPVPVENVIGEVGGGFKIAMNILNGGRFSMGSSGAGMLKRLIGYAAEHAISRTQFEHKIMEFGLIKEKFAEMAVTAYAMESMAYLTSLNLDMYEEPDLSIEAAIVKVFSSEGCWNCASESLQVLGGLGYMKTYPYERYLRDARILMIFEGTNEILRLFIALNCLKYAGKELKEYQKLLRNPLNNPKVAIQFVMKMMGERRGKTPKLTMRLYENVHPTLKPQADELETGTIYLERAVLKLLRQYGNGIIDEQMQLKRLADMAIDLYALTACIGRTSRSLSLGLKNNEHERNLTKLFCIQASHRISNNFRNIMMGDQLNGDDLRRDVAEDIFKHHGWAASHPLDMS